MVDLSAGQELIVRIDLKLNVQPGEYAFSLGTSMPSADCGPNMGCILDRHELLGPIVVVADPAKTYPFYGIARLPMKVNYCRVKKPDFEEML